MPYIMTAKVAGDEISSTYEGRHIEAEESDLVHSSIAVDGFVNKGDPVLMGDNIVGVAFQDASAATDVIAIDTEGIWALTVERANDAGVSNIARGDEIFISRTNAALMLSKRCNIATHVHFGYALSTLTAGTSGIVAVKVHFDPTVDAAKDQYNNVTSGQFGKSLYAYLTGGASEGLSQYFEGHLSANTSGHLYNLGSWINADAQNILRANHIVTPFEGGIYAGQTQTDARIVFAGQHQAILAGVPASMHAWRLNVTQIAGNITALIAAANPQSVGYQAGKAGTGVVGTIPLADVVGTGVVYVDVHAAIA